MTEPRYTFLPWYRRGAARALDATSTLADAIDGRAAPALSLAVNGARVDVPIALYGPGDVTGLDPALVRRLDPPRGATEAEPYHFAAIELAWPDLPWLLTPAGPSSGPLAPGVTSTRLAPWLALVVVRADRSELVVPPRGPARLVVPRALDELPDPAEAWAWAHVQLVGDLDRPLDEIARTEPARLTSRLVSPRKLEPGVAWRACVVPVFAAGRAAGLGEAAPARPLDPAWSPADPAPVVLPAYVHWSFSTAADADFETLARRLVAREAPAALGRLPVELDAPGAGVRGFGAGGAIEGALVREDDVPVPLPAEAAGAVDDLARALDRGADPTVVTAPLYGAPAGTPLPASGWLRELNLDPRLRAIAGLGAEAVRRDDEALVASAWAQLGEVREANRALGWRALAQHVSAGLFAKHLGGLSLGALVAISAPVHARIRLDAHARVTAQVALHAHLAVPSATRPLFRRAMRPTGRLARARVFRPIRPAPTALVTFDRVQGALGRPAALAAIQTARLTPGAIAAAPRRRFRIVDEQGRAPGPSLPFGPDDDAEFRAAARAQLVQLQAEVALAARPRPVRTIEPLDRARLLAALDPAPRLLLDAAAAVDVPPDAPPRAALDPVTGAPRYPQPAIRALTAISDAYVLPGLEHVAANSTTIVAANPRFVEAFLAGMNHELERELVWREFPCARGATYFRRFWDVRGRVGGGGDGDILPIADWDPATPLGTHGTAPAATVLVVRGDLVRRFPGVILSSIPATDAGAPDFDAAETHPIFRGALDPDVVFAAFAFDRAEARRRWFVLQAPPTAPRFGLDASSALAVAALARRNDLAWSHMPAGATHARIDGPLAGRTLHDHDPGTAPESAVWGRTSADVAWSTLQLPVRLALRGSEMIP